jgi:hypothetical protein
MLSGVVGASFLAVTAVPAADAPVKAPYAPPGPLPAVSGLNYNLAAFGGYARIDDRGPGNNLSGGLGGVGGTIVAPLAHAYGLKLSGLVGGWEGEAFYGGAAHLFWRDPAIGLLGVYGSYTRTDAGSAALGRLAVEFQRYLGQYSIEGQIGWEGVDVSSNLFTRLDLGYYLNENLKLRIGHRYTDERHLLAVGAESLFRTAGNHALSGFVEGRFGKDYTVAWAGLRLYFGADKSLIRRHREDDPGNHTTDATDDLIALRHHVKPSSPRCPSGEVFDPEAGQCEFPEFPT